MWHQYTARPLFVFADKVWLSYSKFHIPSFVLSFHIPSFVFNFFEPQPQTQKKKSFLNKGWEFNLSYNAGTGMGDETEWEMLTILQFHSGQI